MAHRAVVGGDARVAQQRGAARPVAVAKAQQHDGFHAAQSERVLQDGKRRDADSASHEDRALPRGRGGEAAPERAER